MWCDNCLLLLPLRAGAIAWATIIVAYSLAGGIFLFRYGQFLFFTYPEWEIYGAIGMGVGLVALINIFALSNRSYIWTRVCKFLWPFIVVISAIRAILIIVELRRGKDKIAWECDNGGQLWSASVAAGYDNGSAFPSGFCSSSFESLSTAFIISLLVDLGFQKMEYLTENNICQTYMLFLNWRFSKRLEHYSGMKGPFYGGYYNA